MVNPVCEVWDTYLPLCLFIPICAVGVSGRVDNKDQDAGVLYVFGCFFVTF